MIACGSDTTVGSVPGGVHGVVPITTPDGGDGASSPEFDGGPPGVAVMDGGHVVGVILMPDAKVD
jgi:hypothetical protein